MHTNRHDIQLNWLKQMNFNYNTKHIYDRKNSAKTTAHFSQTDFPILRPNRLSNTFSTCLAFVSLFAFDTAVNQIAVQYPLVLTCISLRFIVNCLTQFRKFSPRIRPKWTFSSRVAHTIAKWHSRSNILTLLFFAVIACCSHFIPLQCECTKNPVQSLSLFA